MAAGHFVQQRDQVGRPLNIRCDTAIAELYKSAAQRSRVISEGWFSTFGYCLACDQDNLTRTPANTKAADFSCKACGQQYELKTFSRRPSKYLVDGAYKAMLSKIQARRAPTMLLLERSFYWEVINLTAVHSAFLTPTVIERRPPLSPTARRAGWVGCKIRLDCIASDGEISLIREGLVIPHPDVRHAFARVSGLITLPPVKRGWTTLTLLAIRGLNAPSFTLEQVYQQEELFSESYPNNRNVRAKIRQQLQVLRDLGLVAFEGQGRYRLLQ